MWCREAIEKAGTIYLLDWANEGNRIKKLFILLFVANKKLLEKSSQKRINLRKTISVQNWLEFGPKLCFWGETRNSWHQKLSFLKAVFFETFKSGLTKLLKLFLKSRCPGRFEKYVLSHTLLDTMTSLGMAQATRCGNRIATSVMLLG